MPRHSNAKKWAILATLTTATCWAFGIGCLSELFAIIGATFFP